MQHLAEVHIQSDLQKCTEFPVATVSEIIAYLARPQEEPSMSPLAEY